jgi:rSAM/selenodomain-associated transferase 2
MRLPLSIVIPVGPGDASWQSLLPQLEGCATEVILVFAEGHRPATLPQGAAATAIEAPRGRARQLNAGAARANATWLWFLHADTRLEPDAVPALSRFMERDADAIGYFDLEFAQDGPALTRLNALGARWRSRLFGLPFGDQGFAMPARVFQRLDGFPDVGSEDHALVWRARARGIRLERIAAALHTSARKYAEHGWWRTTRTHLAMTLAQARAFSRAERGP